MGTFMLVAFVVAVYVAVRAMSRLRVRRVPIENHRVMVMPDGSTVHDSSCKCHNGRRESSK
jgi:hypothetical protein